MKRSTGHTHTPRENNTPDTHTQHDKNNTPNPQTNTPHKHLTTLEGGATTVSATSHTRVGRRAEVSVGGRVEVRRGLIRARVKSLHVNACFTSYKPQRRLQIRRLTLCFCFLFVLYRRGQSSPDGAAPLLTVVSLYLLVSCMLTSH